MATESAPKSKPSQAKRGGNSKGSGNRRTPKAEGEPVRRLVELGLTLGEARAYVSLLNDSPMTAAQVAASAGIARPKVYEALRLLEERGFAKSMVDESVARFRAVSPSLSLDEWLRHRNDERHLASEQEVDVARELIAALPEPEAPGSETEFFAFVEGIYGRGRTSEMLRTMTGRAESTILNMTQPPWTQPRAQWNVAEIEALKRGVQVRMLLTPVGMGEESRWLGLREQGGEIRLAQTIPMKLIVCDTSEAMISLRDPSTGEQGLSNVIIRHPDIVHSLQLLFDEEWGKAEPIDGSSPA